MQKACFIGALFQVCAFDSLPTKCIGESKKTVAISGESSQTSNQTPVVVNNSGLNQQSTARFGASICFQLP
jgi:hypothetical protein